MPDLDMQPTDNDIENTAEPSLTQKMAKNPRYTLIILFFLCRSPFFNLKYLFFFKEFKLERY